MPTHAMERVSVDHCVKAVDLADLLVRLVAVPAHPAPARAVVPLETHEEASNVQSAVAAGAMIRVGEAPIVRDLISRGRALEVVGHRGI